MENYEVIRNEIRTIIQFLEQQFTQVQIGEIMTNKLGYNVSARDVNFLKNVRNKRWKGPSKRDKLLGFHAEINSFADSINSPSTSTILQSNIEGIVRKALMAEFNLYKSFHLNGKVESLERWFDKTGDAYKKIRTLIKRLTKRNWILNNDGNPSRYELIEMNVISIEPTKIKVKTKEKWYLKWLGIESGEYEFLYNHCNYQEYSLTKVNSKWLISSNVYCSHQLRKPPPLEVPHPELKVKNKEELKFQIEKLVLKGNTDRAIKIAFNFASKHKNKVLSKRIVLLSNCLAEITRLHNTECISLSEYLTKKKNINEVLLLI